MDDIYTIHPTKKKAQESHNKFIQFMKDKHIPIQTTKSVVAAQSAKVLGMQVDLIAHTISPTQTYLNDLQKLNLPQTEKDRRRIKGKLAYISKFLPNFQHTR